MRSSRTPRWPRASTFSSRAFRTPRRSSRRAPSRAGKAKAAGSGVRSERREAAIVPKRFKVGDHVSWNSEAGRVSGAIIKVHTKDFIFKGYTHHASKDDPQYEIKSDKTDHIAAHKGSALKRARR